MVHFLDGYSPFPPSPDHPIATTRIVICSVILIQILIYFILRLIAISNCASRSRQIAPESQGSANQKPQPKGEESKVIQGERRKSEIIKSSTKKVKMCGILSGKAEGRNKNQKTDREKRQSIKPQVKKMQRLGANRKGKAEKKIIFQLQPEDNQFVSGTSSDSSSSSSSSDSQTDPQTKDEMANVANHSKSGSCLVNLKFDADEVSNRVTTLLSHSWIAFCCSLLHFPFLITGVVSIFHLLLFSIFTIGALICRRNTILLNLIYGLVLILNLGLIVLSIFGVAKSNPEFHLVWV